MQIDENNQMNSLLSLFSSTQQLYNTNNTTTSYDNAISTNFEEVMQEEAVQLETSTFAQGMLDKIKSGMSFQEAEEAEKSERFALLFEEELANNGGNVKEAIDKAKDKMDPPLTEEELIGVLEGLAGTYRQAGNTELADSLAEEAEMLREKMSVEEQLELEQKLSGEESGIFTSMMLSQSSNSQTNSVQMQDDFMNNLFANSSKTPKEQRQMQQGIQQYQKVASYM